MRPPTTLKMACVLLFGLFFGLSASSLAVGVDKLDDADRTAIKEVIQAQMAAFQADDALLAFSFAAPGIQSMFDDPMRFIDMVKQGYMPVYRPREVEFADLLHIHGQPTQRVVVVGPDNGVFNAFYSMEQQNDGSWRIGGCVLQPIQDRAI